MANYGKQIFELTPELAEEFLHTDVDAILAGDIVLPFPVIYLHWGARAELRLPDGLPEGGKRTEPPACWTRFAYCGP